MPKVNQAHPMYLENAPIWKRCRVSYEGEDAVKKTGYENLPKLEGQKDDEYDAYKKRSQYPSFLSRVIDSFIGLSLDKEPIIEEPAAMDEYLDNIGGVGVNELDLVRRSLRHNFTTGRLGMLVGKLDALDHPHIAIYSAESIINWGDNFIVLMETYYGPDPKDEFVQKEYVRYRVLKLKDSAYYQEIWEGEGSKWEIKEVIEFRDSKNQTIDFIPFEFIGTDGVDNRISKPSMIDFVNVSMSYYRNSADLEHGLHFTALPWYYVSGVSGSRDQKDETIVIGSSRALKLKDPQAKAGVVEFGGAGLKAIETRMDKKERHMSELGAKILLDHSTGVEAAETKRIRVKADTSLAANVINSVARGIENCLRHIANMEGFDSDIDVTINTELMSAEITVEMLNFLLKAIMAGKLSLETFLEVMKTGKLPADFAVDEEMERIEAELLTEETDMGDLDDDSDTNS